MGKSRLATTGTRRLRHAQGGYTTTGGGYGYSQPGYARPGYNPGGLGGPASGIGVRPGLGAGGFGPGR